MTVRLGPRGLLEYNARYSVLICRECQYAIQKSAVGSHLLRHHIYRTERQNLISSIAKLDLLEPEEVPLPGPTSPPIDALPAVSGYCCTAAGCGHLCASSKRMRCHWRDVHGSSEFTDLSSCARAVKLQTFFRGTKIRYFEITLPAATDDDHEARDQEVHKKGSQTEGVNEESSLVSGPAIAPERSSTSLGLETLTYFHHFTTLTSLTLPGGARYWQTDVVLQALKRQWLMYGVLSLSAYHLATLEEGTPVEVHRTQAAQFFSEFVAGSEDAGEGPKTGLGASETEEAVKKAAAWIRSILDLLHSTVPPSLRDQDMIVGDYSQLRHIMGAVRRIVDPDYPRPINHVPNNQNDHSNDELFGRAKDILDDTRTSDPSSAIFSRLSTLPFRIAAAFERPPVNGEEVLITLSAVATLVECCSATYASDEPEVAWQAMAMWLIRIPDQFHQMVLGHSAADLVVLAHWAAFLLRRAESSGYWVLGGLADKVLEQIVRQLPVAARGLVEGLRI